MKHTKSDIGIATIWYAGDKMVLTGIVENNNLGYCSDYECYTYGGDNIAYHWYRHSLIAKAERIS